MGFCFSTDSRDYGRSRVCQAAGWTTEKSPRGIEVLETEHSSRNVLAQYLHSIFKLHFPFKKFVFLRLAGGKKKLKNKTKPIPTKSPAVKSYSVIFTHIIKSRY